MAKKKLTAVEKVQPPIPGAEQDDKVPEIHKAALDYKQRQQEFSDAGSELSAAKQKLIDKMHDNGKTTYRYGNVEVDLTTGPDKIKVKVTNAEKD